MTTQTGWARSGRAPGPPAGTMSDARPHLTHAIDAADLPDVIEDTTGRACPPRGGTLHDPRPDFQERHASFSVFQRGGVWFWKRRGGPADKGTAWHFLLSLGWDEDFASEYLLMRYGNPHANPAGHEDRRLTPRLTPLERAVQYTELWTPLSLPERRAAWQDVAPVHGPAAHDLQKRGLLGSPVLQAGTLTRSHGWAAPGSLAFGLHNPQGELIAVKLRNPPGCDPKYVLRTEGRGNPTWCSPGYGRAGTLLIVEGELNAAAAAHAAHLAGLDLDVQGLAGLDGSPHLDGLDRDVLLYLDMDDGHEAAQERLTELALSCAAPQVHRLPVLPPGLDFCDVLAHQGPHALAQLLRFPEGTHPRLSAHLPEFGPLPASYEAWPLMPQAPTS